MPNNHFGYGLVDAPAAYNGANHVLAVSKNGTRRRLGVFGAVWSATCRQPFARGVVSLRRLGHAHRDRGVGLDVHRLVG